MASLDSVAARAAAAEEARRALVAEALEAVADGIPKAAVARAAGVSTPTIFAWVRDQPAG